MTDQSTVVRGYKINDAVAELFEKAMAREKIANRIAPFPWWGHKNAVKYQEEAEAYYRQFWEQVSKLYPGLFGNNGNFWYNKYEGMVYTAQQVVA